MSDLVKTYAAFSGSVGQSGKHALQSQHGRLRVGLLVIVFSPVRGFEKTIL